MRERERERESMVQGIAHGVTHTEQYHCESPELWEMITTPPWKPLMACVRAPSASLSR